MLSNKSIYPRACNCCNPPVITKSKQAYSYHIKNSKVARQLNKQEEKEAMSKDKKAKLEYGSSERNWLNSKMDLFKKAVIKSHGETVYLESAVALLEEDMDTDEEPNLSAKVSQLCYEEIENWKKRKIIRDEKSITIQELEDKTFEHYDKFASDEEKRWLKNLGKVNPQIAEHTDNQGRLHAGQPPAYNLSDDDLLSMLVNMKARVEAIEYEIERRVFEPKKIVYEFIGNRFKPVARLTYTQSINE